MNRFGLLYSAPPFRSRLPHDPLNCLLPLTFVFFNPFITMAHEDSQNARLSLSAAETAQVVRGVGQIVSDILTTEDSHWLLS